MKMPKKLNSIHRDESGILLIEVLVSSVLLVIVAVGVFTAFEASTRSTSQERHRARAAAIADADQARMRSMRIADLANLNETTTTNQDGLDYTVVSRADFSDETATTSSCQTGLGSRDYIKITTTVTWPSIGTRPPVVAASLVTPPSGSVVPNSGSLVVNVINGAGAGKSGIGFTGSGPASFSGTTGPTGCVSWSNLPAGNYTLTPSGVSGLVIPEGTAPTSQVVSVVADSTNTVSLQMDSPGAIAVNFRSRIGSGSSYQTESADQITIFHTSLNLNKLVPAAPGSLQTSYTVSGLFPFPSPYAVWAGCENNVPDPGAAIASIPVSPGATSPTTTIQMPALTVNVKTGSSSNSPGSNAANARLRIASDDCSGYKRTFTANSSGVLSNEGLPWGTYDICANSVTGTVRRYTQTNRSVQNLGGLTSTTIYLGASGSSTGTCP